MVTRHPNLFGFFPYMFIQIFFINTSVPCHSIHLAHISLSSLSLYMQIRPFFENTLALPKQNPASALADGRAHLATPVLPIYVSGVLAIFSKASTL